MKIKNIAVKSSIVPLLLLSSVSMSFELSSTVTFTNDYRVNGISQTAGDPAVQASIDGAFDNGAYIGIWGSNVDFGDDANLEVDYYVGYAGGLSEAISYDVTAFYFAYPGYDAADGDYPEIRSNLYWNDFNLNFNFTNDFFNTSEEHQYIALNYSIPASDNVSVDLHAGHTSGNYWTELDIGEYSDYSIGVSTSISGLDLSLAYLFNDIDSENEVDDGLFVNDETIILTISRTF